MNNKINNLMKIAPKYKLTDTFMLLKDKSNGWTDGYIADLNCPQLEGLKAEAMLLNSKTRRNGLIRYFVDPEKCPEIERVIPKTGEQVTNIEYDLESGFAVLKSESRQVKVNPKFLRYFNDMYKKLGGLANCDMELSEENKPIRILLNNELIGVVMPILKS